MRLAVATVFCFFLTACQTVGIQSDPDKATKSILVASGFMVDALNVYGHLPPCELQVSPCKKEKNYQNAKLVALSTVESFQALDRQPSSIFLSAALLYSQFSIAKTLADAPAPTEAEAYPKPATVAYLEAAGIADILVSTADQRVQDALSVNTTTTDLLDQLAEKVAALP